jgi:hypothetical protein
MKKLLTLLVFISFLGLMQLLISCSEPDSDSNPASEETMGEATFWLASDLGLGNIAVTCDGATEIITGYYTSTPDCGSSSSANFSLSPGTHAYSANAGTVNWNGSITVTAGSCSKLELLYNGENIPGNELLNGNWMSSAGNGITISGTQGVFYAFSTNWQTAANGGYVSFGTAKLKNITATGTNQWSCNDLFLTTTNGTIDGVMWSSDGTINMNSNGNSITVISTGPVSGNVGNVVYTKQ